MMNSEKYFKLNNVFLRETYCFYRTIKILKILLIFILILTNVVDSIVSGFVALFVLLLIFLFYLLFKESSKNNKFSLVMDDEVLTIESSKGQKKIEISINNLNKVTFILESYIFTSPNLTPNIVSGQNRILIEKSNFEKIYMIFNVNSCKEMNNLKLQIQRIQSMYPFISIKKALF